jgi:hypothetical protein
MVMPDFVEAFVRAVLVPEMRQKNAMLTKVLVIQYNLVQLGYSSSYWLSDACFLLVSTGRHRVG